MALFLESSYSSSNYSGNFQDLLFTEINSMQEEMQLMEAIYKADFIMHEQNKNLSESARVLKEGNFLINVFNKLKEWVKKAWDWLKNFVIKIKDKIVEIYNRIKDHLTGNTTTIDKAWVAKAEATINRADVAHVFIKKVIKTRDKASLDSLKKSWEAQIKALNKKIDDASKIKGVTTISNTYFDKLIDLQSDIVKDINEAYSEVMSDIKDLEEEVNKRVNDIKNTASDLADKMDERNKEMIALMREITTAIRNAIVGTSQSILHIAGQISGSQGGTSGQLAIGHAGQAAIGHAGQAAIGHAGQAAIGHAPLPTNNQPTSAKNPDIAERRQAKRVENAEAAIAHIKASIEAEKKGNSKNKTTNLRNLNTKLQDAEQTLRNLKGQSKF